MYYALLRRTPWRHHAKLVVVSPEGLPLTQPEAQLLPPLSRLSVQTLADFSRRLLPGFQAGQEVSRHCTVGSLARVCCLLLAAGSSKSHAGCQHPFSYPLSHSPQPPRAPVPHQLDPSQPPASYEGGEQRCFQDAFFCGRNMPLAQGLPPEREAALSQERRTKRLVEQVPIEPFSYGQAVVAYHQQAGVVAKQMRRRPRPPTDAPAILDGISLQQAAAAAAVAVPPPEVERAKSSSGRLRVLFVKRSGEGRQVLNAAELLQRCNSWQYRPPNGSATVTADCSEVGKALGGLGGRGGSS